MKIFRLNRLFNPKSGRCFDVAVDHGFFNQPGFLRGIENIAQVILAIADASPDAIQLTIGQACHLQTITSKQKPALVLRTDVANIYGREPIQCKGAVAETIRNDNGDNDCILPATVKRLTITKNEYYRS